MIRNVLFDLDGTLVDSKKGIFLSIKYALDKMGIETPPEKELMPFLGPPLVYSFEHFIGMSQEDAIRATALYREFYKPEGMFEFSLYPGVETMLKKLTHSGKHLYLATSKPEVYAIEILKKAGIDRYFTAVCGALLPSGRDDKVEIITHLLTTQSLSLEDTVMVGDRFYDIEGAHKVGMAAIGVTYGFGSEKELNRAGADAIAQGCKDLTSIIMTV